MRFIACAPSSGKTLNQREIDNVCLSFRACQSKFPLPWYTLPDPHLQLECEDPADQRISLFAGRPSRERLLIEARLELCRFLLRKPVGRFKEGASFRMLTIHWLSLSDPDRPFTAARF